MKQKLKRESAVSSILRASWNKSSKTEQNTNHFDISIATTDHDKNDAYRLGYDVYFEKGYLNSNHKKILKEEYDHDTGTTILLAKNKQGQAIATVTLVFNRYSNLPCSNLFSCSRTNKNSAEITRLAISENHKSNFKLLAELMTWAFIYAEQIEKTHQFLIEVNPKHQSFYKRVFNFSQLHSSDKPCPRVSGAPAVLLGIDFATIDEMKITKNKVNNRFKIFNSIYQNKKNDIINLINHSRYSCSF